MRLEQLYTFQKIAETGSLRKASTLLYSSPQNISKSMLKLEEELNTTLYTRSRTGVTLTKDGEDAYVLIQNIIDDIDKLNKRFNVSTEIISPEKIQPVYLNSCAMLEPIAIGTVNILLQDFPLTPIQIEKNSSLQIRSFLLSANKIDNRELPDLIMMNTTQKDIELLKSKTINHYNCYYIFEDELCLQVPKNDPLSQYIKIPLEILTNLPLLLYSGSPRNKTESELILQEWGYELKNVSRTSNIEICSQLALNQKRYCFVGFPSVEFRPMPNVSYIPLERSISTWQLMLVKKKNINKKFSRAYINHFNDNFDLKKLW